MARYPDKYKETPVTLTGQVYQPDYTSTEDGWGFRLATKQSEFGKNYYEEDVLVFFLGKNSNDARVLDGDIVRVEGVFRGMITYETVLGASRTVPAIQGQYYTILS